MPRSPRLHPLRSPGFTVTVMDVPSDDTTLVSTRHGTAGASLVSMRARGTTIVATPVQDPGAIPFIRRMADAVGRMGEPSEARRQRERLAVIQAERETLTAALVDVRPASGPRARRRL